VPHHPLVEDESTALDELGAPRVARVEDRHIVLFRHRVDCVHEAEEIALRVDVLLAVRGEEDVASLAEAEVGQDRARIDLVPVGREHFCHGGARHIGALLGPPLGVQVAARVLGVAEVHIGDVVHDAPVRLLGEALVETAVAGLHVENGDVQALGRYRRQAGVGVAEDEQGVRHPLAQQGIGFGDDIPDGLSEVGADRVQVDIGGAQVQILEENLVELVVVVLAGVHQELLEVSVALLDDFGEADYLGARSHDGHKLKFTHSHLFEVRVGLFRIEALIRPHDSHKVIGVGKVDDAVGVAWYHLNHPDMIAAHREFHDRIVFPFLILADFAQPNEPGSADYHELLVLAVVPVVAFGDAGLGDVDADLSPVGRAQEFGEAAAGVNIHLQVVGKLLGRQIGEPGAVEFGDQGAREIRDTKRCTDLGEAFYGVGDEAQRRLVVHGNHTIVAGAGLVPVQRPYHLVDQVVDMDDIHRRRGIVHLYRHIVGHIVAEGRYRRVIVGLAPLTIEIGKSVDEHLRARLSGVSEEQLLPRLLALAVLRAGVTPFKARLHRRGQDYRSRILMLFQARQQLAGKTEIARHKFALILGPVHPG